ncbi:MAG: carboxymuconolactone decarboxylase family protein [Cardiobacteriaceae bacterium]|nr:carboxymuconolactone decarboxylase family protein [Cardiobacteriaceae bacterium]
MYEYKEVTAGISAKLKDFSKEIPDTMKAFSQLAQAANKEGALNKKQKELIALGIGIANRCQGCIGFHSKTLAELGTTRAEFLEMLQVAVYMGGGPSLMTAAEALAAYEEFGGEKE